MNCLKSVRRDCSSNGFTIVEVIIVMVIMAVILTLGVVNYRDTQISSRDKERITDIETIGQYLDIYYTSGTDATGATYDYPPTTMADSTNNMTTYLRNISKDSLKAPGIADPFLTFKAATNNTQTAAGVAPQPTVNQYVYQPIQANGSLCTLHDSTHECRKYNLYYHLEADDTVYKVTSRYQ